MKKKYILGPLELSSQAYTILSHAVVGYRDTHADTMLRLQLDLDECAKGMTVQDWRDATALEKLTAIKGCGPRAYQEIYTALVAVGVDPILDMVELPKGLKHLVNRLRQKPEVAAIPAAKANPAIRAEPMWVEPDLSVEIKLTGSVGETLLSALQSHGVKFQVLFSGSEPGVKMQFNLVSTASKPSQKRLDVKPGKLLRGPILSLHRNFGFIKQEGKPGGLFFYKTDLQFASFDNLAVGDMLSYTLGTNDQGVCAREIQLVK
jgi:cold shock CspA family protein